MLILATVILEAGSANRVFDYVDLVDARASSQHANSVFTASADSQNQVQHVHPIIDT